MSHNRYLMTSLIDVFFLITGMLIWAMTPSTSSAQCGDNPPPKSSCITCHEKEYPVYKNGEWHGIHALKDCCTSCHGGNCGTMDKDLAHEDLVVNPLEDVYTNCYKCHPDDYQARAERFGALLGVTPRSSPTATPFPTEQAVVGYQIVILPTTSLPAPHLQQWLPELWAFTMLIITLLAVGVAFYYLQVRKHTIA
jgi:hypothetical protein